MDHLTVPTRSGRAHVVVAGDGPLVLFVHGFPESWYSWRSQLPALAAAGFRAAALDVRGYGRSSRPARRGLPDAAESRHRRRDRCPEPGAGGNGQAVVVGHDWGSPITANAALLRPDVVRAVALLSVPYTPRGGPRPTEYYARVGGDDTFYIDYFQQRGRAEAEIEPDIRGWVLGMFASLSADTMSRDRTRNAFFVPPGGTMRERFVRRPPGLAHRRGGGVLRRGVRAHGSDRRPRPVPQRRPRLRRPGRVRRRPITQPSLFVGGSHDPVVHGGRDAIAAFDRTLPGLRGVHVLDGVGHWVQQEAPDAVNTLLVDWLRTL